MGHPVVEEVQQDQKEKEPLQSSNFVPVQSLRKSSAVTTRNQAVEEDRQNQEVEGLRQIPGARPGPYPEEPDSSGPMASKHEVGGRHEVHEELHPNHSWMMRKSTRMYRTRRRRGSTASR